MSSLKILSVQRASIYLRTLFKTAPPFKIIAPMTSHNEVAKGCSLSTCSKRNITPIAQPEIVSNTSQSCSLTTCPNKTPQEVITKPEIVSNSSQPCSLSTCPNKICQQQVIAQPEIISNTSQSCSLSTCPNKTPQEVVTKPENVSNASQPCSLSTCPYKNSSPIVQPEVVSNSSQPCSLSTCPNKNDLTEPNMVPDYLQPCSLSTCPNEHCSPLAKPEGQIFSQPCCLSTCPHKNVQEPTAKPEIEPDSFGPCSLSTCPNEYCSSNAKPEGPISSQPCSLSTCPYKNVQQPTIQPEMGVSSSQPCSLSTCPTKNLVKPAMLTIVSQPCAFSTCPNKNQPPIIKPEIIPISPKPCSMCSCRKKKPCEQPVSPPHQTYKIVMIRHGESEWNQKNLFTGWYDTHLSCKGHQEAKRAGAALKKAGYCFDVAFTSVLSRANMTLNYVLKALNQEDMPIIRSWRLNERHYGALTGLNKAETAAKYGEEKVTIWRRSYDIPPPPMERNHPYYKEIVFDKRYANDPPRDEFPMFESLKLTLERTMPFWEDTIVPEIKNGFRVIIAAHGNSLRGLVKTIERMSDKQILGVNLPTGIPFYYILGEDMKALPGTTMQFLGDPETVKAAMDAVAKQGKKK